MKRFLLFCCVATSFFGMDYSPSFAAADIHRPLYDKDYVGKMETYTAKYEDTLVHLAREHGLGFVEMRAANPALDPWIPGAGARITLPKQALLPEAPRSGIVINLPEMKLYYFQGSGTAPLLYAISPGREGLNTPTGTTTIVRKVEGPTWTPTPRMRKEDPTLQPFYGPGPDNPMGTNALYLGWPEYAIHGTNKPYAIGRRASSGCIRMYPEGIRDLFYRVPVGTQVTVVDQPVKVGWIGDKMYVEVSPTQEQSIMVEQNGTLSSYEITAQDMKRITKKAGDFSDQINWEAVRDAVREHRGYPVVVLNSKKGKGGKEGPVTQASAPSKALEARSVPNNETTTQKTPISSTRIDKTSAVAPKPTSSPSQDQRERTQNGRINYGRGESAQQIQDASVEQGVLPTAASVNN